MGKIRHWRRQWERLIVSGLQNDGDLKEGMLACAKHFVGYHMTQGGIHAASTPVPPRMLREVYAKPFQAVITLADMKSIMNTYSSIDGEPVAGSRKYLTEFLRGEMGFDGLIVSDYVSISEIHSRHRVAETLTDAGELSLKAGMEVELPAKDCYNDELMQRIRNGKIPMEVLDQAVRRVLIAKFELGLFENPYPMPSAAVERIYADPNNEATSLEAARQSIVLLKNNGLLPLQRNAQKKIAVIGHHAASTRSLFGGYSYASLFDAMHNVGNTMAGVDFEKISNLNATEFGVAKDHYTYPGSIVQVESPKTEELVRKHYPTCHHLLEQIILECPDAEVTYAYGYAYAGNDTSMHDEALAAAAKRMWSSLLWAGSMAGACSVQRAKGSIRRILGFRNARKASSGNWRLCRSRRSPFILTADRYRATWPTSTSTLFLKPGIRDNTGRKP
ncbi:hypothetical protein HMSSN036_67610 [Paenibacillus macerans]|nr:hypothetical protein HMSSN036_67610 [Paenibacillus macerans]